MNTGALPLLPAARSGAGPTRALLPTAPWGPKHSQADEAFRTETERRVAKLPRPRRRAIMKALDRVQVLTECANIHRRAAGDASKDAVTRAQHLVKARRLLGEVLAAQLRVELVGVMFVGDDDFTADLDRIHAELEETLNV